MRIAEEKINEIRQAVDIVDVISEYVQLRKQGRNYLGLCPFHGEKTPSFSVSPEKQIFHCFGCGAGGNAFSFLMEIEGISFQEAAIRLAEIANIELNMEMPQTQSESQTSQEEKRMIEAHELLRKFYHHLLVNTKEGQEALEYLIKRGFNEETIEKFQIGYSLNSWDFAFKLLAKRGFDPPLLERAGLIIKSDRDEGYFDRFRHRVMFPIFDNTGNTIAFSGRALGADEPKYLNSPETAIFNKSKILYNFHLARPSIRKSGQAVLFEGFADCIAADRAGVQNGVATMGTALTPQHIRLLRKNSSNITLCYDSDNAGIEAAFKAANMLAEAGSQVRIAIMPDGLDPDEYMKKYGDDKFLKDVIGNSLTLMAFKLLYLKRGKNLQNEGEKLQYVSDALVEMSKLENAVERDHYVRQLANEFSLSHEALNEQLRQIIFSKTKQKQKNGNNKINLSRVALRGLKPAYYNAEQRLIYYMLRDVDIALKVQEQLKGTSFNIDEHQAIITYLYGYYESGMEADPVLFMDFLPDEKLRRVVAEIEMLTINDELSEQELNDYIHQVLKQQKMLTIKEKEKARLEAERHGDFMEAAKIAMEIIQLRKSL